MNSIDPQSSCTSLRMVVAAAIIASAAVADAGPVSIDGSTVRVFSIGTVGTEEIDIGGVSQLVANVHGGHGTGFVVDGGLVLTAQHVVDGARHVVVRLPGSGGFYAARVVYADKPQDIAVLALDAGSDRLPDALPVAKQAPRVRATVFAVGYPIDPTRTQPQSARGIIAGYLDDGTIQLDMAVNPGNSGGPIVDEKDAVVAMVVARGALEKGVQGIAYAVPPSKLTAALAEAARVRADEGEGRPLSRDSAKVVDQLVQYGALYQLRGAARSPADLERALAALLGTIDDADLLVCVAGALWNAAVALDHTADDRTANDTREAPGVIAIRLRAAARRAIKRAVELDGDVRTRSPFVALGSRSEQRSTGVASTQTEVARFGAADSQPTHLRFAFTAAPLARINPAAASVGFGGGAAARVAFGRSSVLPFVGVAFGTVTVGDFTHTLVAAELGLELRVGRVELVAAYAPCWYQSSVSTTTEMGTASAITSGFRLAAGIRLGNHVALGTGVRALSGPTLWAEPVYLAVAF